MLYVSAEDIAGLYLTKIAYSDSQFRNILKTPFPWMDALSSKKRITLS